VAQNDALDMPEIVVTKIDFSENFPQKSAVKANRSWEKHTEKPFS